jgi:hypothetical protein
MADGFAPLSRKSDHHDRETGEERYDEQDIE